MKFCPFAITILFVFFSCGGKDATPKPMAYPRVDRENNEWKSYENAHFSFDYPSDSKIIPQQASDKNEVWINVTYPAYGITLHCTYLPVTKNTLPKALEDNYKLAYSHASKAEGINQIEYSNDENHTYGILYDIEGLVAVPVQFYITDSISHLFRGSLYYNNQVTNVDSIEPITESLREDVKRIMSTIQWK